MSAHATPEATDTDTDESAAPAKTYSRKAMILTAVLCLILGSGLTLFGQWFLTLNMGTQGLIATIVVVSPFIIIEAALTFGVAMGKV